MGRSENDKCLVTVMSKLDTVLRSYNVYAQTFNMVKDVVAQVGKPERVKDKRRHNEPNANEVAIVFIEESGWNSPKNFTLFHNQYGFIEYSNMSPFIVKKPNNPNSTELNDLTTCQSRLDYFGIVMSCTCTPDFPECLRAPDIEPTNQDESLFNDFSTTVVFEPTPIGTIKRKAFKIQNNSECEHSYAIRRDSNVNPIYRVFDFKLIGSTVGKGEYLECVVVYNPQITNEKSVEYIEIIDDESTTYKIYLQGECIGPIVNVSANILFFHTSRTHQEVVKNFELCNTSSVPIFYQFDINELREDEPIFRIDKMRGSLEPFQHTYVRVVFVARSIGIFCQSLVCLITHHPPVIIELVGMQVINLNLSLSEKSLKRFPMQTEECEGYGGYMYDSLSTSFHKPPFTWSVNYLNFGNVEVKKSYTLTTSLTNHLSKEIEIIWENDSTESFSINPKEIIIPAEESVLYECQYRPKVADQLHSNIFRGFIHWSYIKNSLSELDQIELLDVPIPITLKVVGHSFPKNKEWIPRVDIQPTCVILPPAMPNLPSYTTIFLKANGTLPTLFKFLPPEKTHFLLKPMTGIIHNFQIIVVQLQPNSINGKGYAEKWSLELNGRASNVLPFCLKGYSEYATLIVGVDNVVKFKTVFPGCQDISSVMLKNMTCHYLEYKFHLEEDDLLHIDHPHGQIASNERKFIKWYATGHLRAPEVAIVKCHVRTVRKTKLLTGTPLDIFVKMYTKCVYSELCATPRNVDLEVIRWGKNYFTSFQLFNFGESPIHFKLSSQYESGNEDELLIVPSEGSVYPKGKFEVCVNLKVYKTGHQDVKLIYHIRVNEFSNVLIDDEKYYSIFSLKYFGTYPTLQIEDLIGSNFGCLFSKVVLWDLFNLDGINQVLREIEHDQTVSVEFFLPDYEMGDADFSGTLVIKNITQFDTELIIKREFVCDCKFRYVSKGISFRQKAYDCFHRDMFKFDLSDDHILADHIQKLKFDVKYLEHGLTRILYSLSLSDNRTVNLYVNINVLPTLVTKPSMYARSYDLNLKPIFIGEMEPTAQVFPLYNNSELDVNYTIDDTDMLRINFDYDFDIFKCVTPEGHLPPFTTKDIIFQFIPIEVRKYEVSVELTMGEETYFLNIRGEGIAKYNFPIGEAANKMPCSSKSQLENIIELSMDHIIVEPFPVWSTIEKMIFIRNQTPSRIIGYSWQTCTVEGTIKAEVVHSKGVLKPKESHAIIVRLSSFDQPCQLRLQLACKLLDHSQHLAHKESAFAHREKEEELDGQFTITEKGISYPKNPIVIEPKAQLFFTTLSLNVCITSIPDRDLHTREGEDLEHAPQYSLRVDTQYIFKNYIKNTLPDKSKLRKDILRKIDGKNRSAQKGSDNIEIQDDYIKLFTMVAESVVGDAIFSRWFDNVLNITENSNQPYYAQMRLHDDEEVASTPQKTESKESIEKRMELVEHFLNKPQVPVLAKVYKELIADGVHEIFELGPQVKHETQQTYIYHSSKRKFTCPVCKCDL